MNWRGHLHRFSDLLAEEIPFDWPRDEPVLFVAVSGSILLGPVLLLAFKLQRDNVRSPWDSEDHWAGTRQFALTFLVWDGLLALLWFSLQAQVVLLRSEAFWCWLLLHLLLWYALLAPTLALLLERLDPRTVPLERTLLPLEQPAPAQTKPASRRQTQVGGSASRQEIKAPGKRKKGRAVPLGQLLLEEREAQRQQARQLRFVQPPALSGEQAVAPAPGHDLAPDTSKAPPASASTDWQQPESLDQLF